MLLAAIVLLAAAGVTIWRLTTPDDPPAAPAAPAPAPVPLARGQHFVFVSSIDDDALLVDPARLLSGQEAIDAAIVDGVIQRGEEFPGEFFISNPGADDRVTLPVSSNLAVTVLTFDSNGSIVRRISTFPRWSWHSRATFPV